MSATYVYNATEHVNVFRHDGVEYPIANNAATAIKSQTKGATDAQVAQYAVDRLGKWGVCIVSGAVKNGKASNAADQKLVDAAEAKYHAAMTAWSEEQVMEAHKANEPRLAAGLPPLDPTDSLQRARKFLGVKK